MIKRFVTPIVIAGVSVIALGCRPWRSCGATERAVLLEFPQYARVQQGPERDEAGGCAVFYDARDKPDIVRAYLVRQLASHGWKIQPSDASGPEVGFSAVRGSFMYSVSVAPHNAAAGTGGQDSPTASDTHVAIHVQGGVMLADARVDVEVYSAASLDETREKARVAGAAMERDPEWSNITLEPLTLDVESSSGAHQFMVRAHTRTLPAAQHKVIEEMARRISGAFR